ncbi:hypothetical protein PINS_up001399 [Pythium insidiosum]|nr:hypothetical protein PINS_up001399 [Pythium insidiosum]
MALDDSEFDWTVSYVTILSIAMLTTFCTLVLSFKHIKVDESAVQYILYALCRSYFIYSASRWLFYIAVLCNWKGLRDKLDDIENGRLVGVRVVYANETGNNLEVILIISLLGDISLLTTTFWVITMAFEMTRLIAKNMDRGRERERRIIRNYVIRTYSTGVLFASAMVFSAWLSPGQKSRVQRIAFGFQLICIWVSFLYPLYCTLKISFQKRTHVVIHPESLVLHQRIKRLVIVYCVLVFPACIIELLVQWMDDVPIVWIGLSQGLYYLSGAGTAFVIGASVTCVYHTLQPIMPVSVYEHLIENGFFPEERRYDPAALAVEPPLSRPIFVCTDIEGSTALWAKDPAAMSEAQSLHDDLLRRELIRYRGYEITTCGDAFQLAFHTVSDAIGWCVSIQEKLLKVHWPDTLLKADNTARIYDLWGRLVFNGLRVRMAIHAGDDKLVCSKHPTTGKMTYLGVSEIVAREMGDMGRGGEIVISDPALQIYESEERDALHHLAHDTFKTDTLETPFERADLQISFPIHHITPNSLVGRFRREEEVRADHAAAHLVLLRAL